MGTISNWNESTNTFLQLLDVSINVFDKYDNAGSGKRLNYY